MTRFLMTAAFCVTFVSSAVPVVAETNRPQSRPTLCRVEAGHTVRPCWLVWNARYDVRPVAPRQAQAVKTRKIVRLPWTIGAFQ